MSTENDHENKSFRPAASQEELFSLFIQRLIGPNKVSTQRNYKN